jgi:hypothetical protein
MDIYVLLIVSDVCILGRPPNFSRFFEVWKASGDCRKQKATVVHTSGHGAVNCKSS